MNWIIAIFLNLSLSSRIFAHPFSNEEYIIVKKENLKGLANSKGKILIPVEYEDLGWSDGKDYLLENVIGYRKNGLWGLLNIKNERVADPEFTSLVPFDDGLLVGAKKLPYNKEIVYGLINTKGKTELEFTFNHLEKAGKNLIAVKEELGAYRHGLIDSKGRALIPLKFREVQQISSTTYGVMNSQKKMAIYEENGTLLYDFKLDSITHLSNRYSLIYNAGKAGVFDVEKKEFIETDYKSIELNGEGNLLGTAFDTWLLLNHRNQIQDTFYYDRVFPLAKGIYEIEVGDAEALIDSLNQNLTGFKRLDIGSVYGNTAVFKENDKYGILALTGEELCPAHFDSVTWVEDFFMVKERLYGKSGWSLYNHNGKRLSKELYDELYHLKGRFFQARKNKYWGVINGVGKEVLLCKYDSVITYVNGKFEVRFMGEDGILDINEEWVIMPQKKEIEIIDPIRYLVRSPYGSYVAFYPSTIELQAEYFLYKKGDIYLERTLDNKFGLMDQKGRKIMQPIFDAISDLHEDSIYITQHENKHSFVSKHGVIMNFGDDRFEQIRPMSDYMIGVQIDGQWGFVDVYGKLRIANRYEDIGPFSEGMGAIKILGKWGFVSKREVLKVQPRYEKVTPFRDGLSIVIQNGKYGLIDKEGQKVLYPEFDEITSLNMGGYITVKENRKGLAGKNGNSFFQPRFDEVKDLRNGYMIVERNGKFGLMSADGLSPIPMIYTQLLYDRYRDLYLAEMPNEPVEIDLQ